MSLITSFVVRSRLFLQPEFISEVLQFQNALFAPVFALFWNALNASQKESLFSAFSTTQTSLPSIQLLLLEMEMIVREFDPSSLFLSSCLLPLSHQLAFSFASSLHFDVTAFRLLNSSFYHHTLDASLLPSVASFASGTKDEAVLTSLLSACSQFHASNTAESEQWSSIEERCLISLGRWSEVEFKDDEKKNCVVAFKERWFSKVLELTEHQNADYFRKYRICALLLQEQYDQMNLEFQKWGEIPSLQWENDSEEDSFFFFSIASSLHALLQHRLDEAIQLSTHAYSSYLHHHLHSLKRSRNSLASMPLLAFLHQFTLFLQRPSAYSFAFLRHSLLSTEDSTKWSLLLSFQQIIDYSCSLLQCPQPWNGIDSYSQPFCCLRLRLSDQLKQTDKTRSQGLVREVWDHATARIATTTGSELSEWVRIREWARVKELCWEVKKEEVKDVMTEMEGMYPCPELFEGYMLVDGLIHSSFPSITSSPEYLQFLLSALHCSSSSPLTILHHLLHAIHTSSFDCLFVASSAPTHQWRPLFPLLIHSFLHRTRLWGSPSFQSSFYSALIHYFVSDASVAREILLPLLEEDMDAWSDEVRNDYWTKHSRALESALVLQKGLVQLQEGKFCALYKLVRSARTEEEARAALPEMRAILAKSDLVGFVSVCDFIERSRFSREFPSEFPFGFRCGF